MTLSYRARRRWALAVLLVALPLYVAAAVTLTDWLRARYEGLPVLVELIVFVVLGVVWIVPLKRIFIGVGQPDADQDKD